MAKEMQKCEFGEMTPYEGKYFRVDKEKGMVGNTVGMDTLINTNRTLLFQAQLRRITGEDRKWYHNAFSGVQDVLSSKRARLKKEDARLYNLLNEFKNQERDVEEVKQILDRILEPLMVKTPQGKFGIKKTTLDQGAYDEAFNYLMAKQVLRVHQDTPYEALDFSNIGLYNFNDWANKMSKGVEAERFNALPKSEQRREYYNEQKNFTLETEKRMQNGQAEGVKEFLNRYNQIRNSMNERYASLFEELTATTDPLTGERKPGRDIRESLIGPERDDYLPMIVENKAQKTIKVLNQQGSKEFSDKAWKKAEGTDETVIVDMRQLLQHVVQTRLEGIRHFEFMNGIKEFDRVNDLGDFSAFKDKVRNELSSIKDKTAIQMPGMEEALTFSKELGDRLDEIGKGTFTEQELSDIKNSLEGKSYKEIKQTLVDKMVSSFATELNSKKGSGELEDFTNNEGKTNLFVKQIMEGLKKDGRLKSYKGIEHDINRFIDAYHGAKEESLEFKKVKNMYDALEEFQDNLVSHVVGDKKINWVDILAKGVNMKRDKVGEFGKSYTADEHYVLTNKYGIELAHADKLTDKQLEMIAHSFEQTKYSPKDILAIMDQVTDAHLGAEGHEVAHQHLNKLLQDGEIRLVPKSVADATMESVRKFGIKERNAFIKGAIKIISWFKRSWLYAPMNVARYAFRNMLGDGRVMLGNMPSAFLRMGDAAVLIHMHSKAHNIKGESRLPMELLKDKQWVHDNLPKWAFYKEKGGLFKWGQDLADFVVNNADLMEAQKQFGATWTDANMAEFHKTVLTKEHEDYLRRFGFSVGDKEDATTKTKQAFEKFKGGSEKFFGGMFGVGESFSNFLETQRRVSVALEAKRKIDKVTKKIEAAEAQGEDYKGKDINKIYQVLNIGGADMNPIDAANTSHEKAVIYANTMMGDYQNVPDWIKASSNILPFLSFRYATGRRFVKAHTNYTKAVADLWKSKQFVNQTWGIAKQTAHVAWYDAVVAGITTGMWNLGAKLAGLIDDNDPTFEKARRSEWGLGHMFGLKIDGIHLFDSVGYMPKIPGLTSSANLLGGGFGKPTWDNSANFESELISTFFNPYSSQEWYRQASAGIVGMSNPLMKMPVEMMFKSDIIGNNIQPWDANSNVWTKMAQETADMLGLAKPWTLIESGIQRHSLQDPSGYDNLMRARAILGNRRTRAGLEDQSGTTMIRSYTGNDKIRQDIKMAYMGGNSKRLAELINQLSHNLKDEGKSAQSIKSSITQLISRSSVTMGMSKDDLATTTKDLSQEEIGIIKNAIAFQRRTLATIGAESLLPTVLR